MLVIGSGMGLGFVECTFWRDCFIWPFGVSVVSG